MTKKDIFNVVIKNPAFNADYYRKLKNIIDKYQKQIVDIIDKNYYSDAKDLDFVSIFQQMAKSNSEIRSQLSGIPESFFNKRLKTVGASLERNIKKSFVKHAEKNIKYYSADKIQKTAVIPAIKFTATRSERAFIRSATEQNASLIKSIGEESINRASNAISSAMQNGTSRADLFQELSKGYGITKRRAANIAIDQGNKITEQLAMHKMKSAGIKQGVWIHSHGDKQPRRTHLKFDGKIFDLDKGLYDSQVQKWVKPGELINCTCTFSPVIPKEWMA